ncbi:MAG: urea ABC transporter substrate-binding protein [Mariprofundales bacterium]
MQRYLLWVPVAIVLVVVSMALLPEDAPAPIKVGILHSLTGTMAVSEKPVMEATLLAIEQINAKGGLLGRNIEPVIVDGKSDPAVFAREAERLISEEHVSVVFGCWTSACRKMVAPVFEQQHNLLFYPVQYEGLERSPNIIYTGAVPNQQIIPAVSWALKKFGSRIYLIGSDYVFPRVANWLIRKQVTLLKGSVVGERYILLGSRDVDAIVADIKQRKPSVVINTINGDSNFAFFHALHEAGVTADDIPVLSFSIGEAELAQLSADEDGIGHYAAWNYFQSIDRPENHQFISAFRARFGQGRVLTDPMEAAWLGVYLWAKAVRSAQSDETAIIQQTIAHQSINAPEGVVSVDHQTHHLWKTVRIGKVMADRQFSVVWSSHTPVRPDPFPALINKREAGQFLQQLYVNWDHHWSRPQGDAR